jgi:GNAT superfamily N-acetyltransferase
VVTIRHARPADARAIAEAHVAGWRWAYQNQLPASVLDGLSVHEREAFWRSQLEAPGAGKGCLVAEVDGHIGGFASYGPGAEDDGPAIPDAGELYAIYLLHDALGTGVGRALLSGAEDGLRTSGFASAFLWVLETNDLARRFYEKADWTWDGSTSQHRFDCGNRPIVRYASDL